MKPQVEGAITSSKLYSEAMNLVLQDVSKNLKLEYASRDLPEIILSPYQVMQGIVQFYSLGIHGHLQNKLDQVTTYVRMTAHGVQGAATLSQDTAVRERVARDNPMRGHRDASRAKRDGVMRAKRDALRAPREALREPRLADSLMERVVRTLDDSDSESDMPREQVSLKQKLLAVERYMRD